MLSTEIYLSSKQQHENERLSVIIFELVPTIIDFFPCVANTPGARYSTNGSDWKRPKGRKNGERNWWRGERRRSKTKGGQRNAFPKRVCRRWTRTVWRVETTFVPDVLEIFDRVKRARLLNSFSSGPKRVLHVAIIIRVPCYRHNINVNTFVHGCFLQFPVCNISPL